MTKHLELITCYRVGRQLLRQSSRKIITLGIRIPIKSATYEYCTIFVFRESLPAAYSQHAGALMLLHAQVVNDWMTFDYHVVTLIPSGVQL